MPTQDRASVGGIVGAHFKIKIRIIHWRQQLLVLSLNNKSVQGKN